jgi:translocation and assembly module TamA
LWNYRDFDPPLWVFGIRGSAFTTITGEDPVTSTKIPPTFLHFLGGSADIRGFGRQELPTNGVGALTSLYAGLEWRWITVFPFGMEPFLFLDAGALGMKAWRLEQPIYWSPGFGIRWPTSFGTFRTTFAHGFPSDVPGHFQFYFSFGEEF